MFIQSTTKQVIRTMKPKIYLITVFLAIVITVGGCTSTGSYVSTEKVTSDFFVGEHIIQYVNYEGIKRTPIIVIHGFQGAELIDSLTNKTIWGNFRARDAFYIPEENILKLAHPVIKGMKLNEMEDNITPKSILKDVNISILGIPIKFTAYATLINELTKAGFQSENNPLDKGKHYYTLFEFAYDWRKDLPGNTVKLENFIKEKRKYLQQKYKELYNKDDFDVQFNIIAHSMGGLLSRYYLQYGTQDLPEDGSLPKLNWSGSKYIERLIVAGTPNAGYLDSFIELLQGGQLKTFTPALLGTFPTYYQMLPAPCTNSVVYSEGNKFVPVNIFKPELWKKMKWGLMSPEADLTLKNILPAIKIKEERKNIAYDHLKKCLKRAEQFSRAMKISGTPPDGVELYLTFGADIRTSRRAHINKITGIIEKIEYSSGDGKVLSTSAGWDLRICGERNFFIKSPIKWRNILPIRAAHMGILDSNLFIDYFLYLLPMIETIKQQEILSN